MENDVLFVIPSSHPSQRRLPRKERDEAVAAELGAVRERGWYRIPEGVEPPSRRMLMRRFQTRAAETTYRRAVEDIAKVRQERAEEGQDRKWPRPTSAALPSEEFMLANVRLNSFDWRYKDASDPERVEFGMREHKKIKLFLEGIDDKRMRNALLLAHAPADRGGIIDDTSPRDPKVTDPTKFKGVFRVVQDQSYKTLEAAYGHLYRTMSGMDVTEKPLDDLRAAYATIGRGMAEGAVKPKATTTREIKAMLDVMGKAGVHIQAASGKFDNRKDRLAMSLIGGHISALRSAYRKFDSAKEQVPNWHREDRQKTAARGTEKD